MFRLSLLALLFTQAQDEKTYDIRFIRKPVVDRRMDFSGAMTASLKIVMSRKGEELKKIDVAAETEIAGTWIVTRMRRDESPAAATWEFTKATRTLNGKRSSLGIELETIDVAWPEGGPPTYALRSGRRLSAGDQNLFHSAVASEAEPETDLYRPKKPVRVGETWIPDVAKLGADLIGSEGDAKSAKGGFTIKSVATSDAGEIATISGSVTVDILKLNGRSLHKPLPMKITIEGTLGIGACAAKSLTTTVAVRGTTTTDLDGEPVDVDVDVAVTLKDAEQPAK